MIASTLDCQARSSHSLSVEEKTVAQWVVCLHADQVIMGVALALSEMIKYKVYIDYQVDLA